MSVRHQVRLGTIAEIFDGPHATPAKTETGPVFLGISSLARGRLDLSNADHLSEVDYRRWTRRVTPQEGDVVFSYETRIGEAAVIPRGLRCCLGRRMGLLRAKPSLVDARFLAFAYLGPEFQDTLRSRTIHGSTVDRIPLLEMPEFPVTVPVDIEEQRAIAHILGALDDKIELNRRMNETLEAIARALFKSWFVDFDPVRAKAEGRDTGLPKNVADLFPDSFEESELGKVPAGWRVCRWRELVELRYGKSLSGTTSETGRFPVYGTNGQIGMHDSSLCSHPGIVIGRKGAYRGVHFSPSPFFVIDTAFYVEPLIETELRWAYYELLRVDINGMDSGSAIPSTSREDFYGLSVVRPMPAIQRAYSEICGPLWERQEASKKDSLTLAALRDVLLPKLISGEIRIKDAERFVGAATSPHSPRWKRSR